MSFDIVILFVAVVFGLYMAWNVGANDVANAMGTSVGSKALTFKQAVLVAAIFEFAGALLVGAHVTETIKSGIIVPTELSSDLRPIMLGMMAALLAAGLWLHLASAFGWPVSTTHSIVGAIAGFGLIGGGFHAIVWSKMIKIIASWLISPVLGAVIAAAMFIFIDRRIINAKKPSDSLTSISPYLIFLVILILVLSFVYKGLKNLHLDLPLPQALLLSSVVAGFAAIIGKVLIERMANNKEGGFDLIEGVFRYLQILTASYVAFAHGANDVANAIGPLAAVVSLLQTKSLVMQVEVPLWILFLGGGGIVLGLATFGYRVIETVGKKITEITPTRGFSAEFGAATTVLVASKLGLPISTTHTLVGAVIGVGLARGMAALNLNVVKEVFVSWGLTLPATALLAAIIFKVLIFII